MKNTIFIVIATFFLVGSSCALTSNDIVASPVKLYATYKQADINVYLHFDLHSDRFVYSSTPNIDEVAEWGTELSGALYDCSDEIQLCVSMAGGSGLSIPRDDCLRSWQSRGANYTVLSGGCAELGPLVIQVVPRRGGALYRYQSGRGVTWIEFKRPGDLPPAQFHLESPLGILSEPLPSDPPNELP